MQDELKRQEPGERAGISNTKRAMLKAGWVVPVIMVVSVPRVGFAANMSGPTGSSGKSGDQGNGDGNGNGQGVGEMNSNGHGHINGSNG